VEAGQIELRKPLLASYVEVVSDFFFFFFVVLVVEE